MKSIKVGYEFMCLHAVRNVVDELIDYKARQYLRNRKGFIEVAGYI